MIKQLIVEVFKNTGLKELTDLANVPEGMMMIEGVLGCVDKVNRNKRFYPRDEYAKHIEAMQKRITESNGLLGEMEHPKSMNIDLNNVSHKVMTVRLDEDGFVRGRVLLLDTPKGKIAQSIIRSGTPLPISSRAIGRVQEDGSVKLDYMSTYDLVGTSGFAEASMQAAVLESFDAEGNQISETYVHTLDDEGNAISESTLASIVETVTETLKKSFVHVNDIDTIVENRLAAMTPSISQTISESLSTQENQGGTGLTMDSVISAIDNRFANTYSPIIENWQKQEMLPEFANLLENWLITEHAPTLQAWIVEDVLPENAALTEKWLMNDFAPKYGEVIQEWLTNDFAPILEAKLQTETTVTGAIVTETADTSLEEPNVVNDTPPAPATDALDDKGQAIVQEPDTDKPVEELKTTAGPVIEAAKQFSSRLLESTNNILAEAKAIKEASAQIVTETVDNSEFKFAPKWLQLIPEDCKPIWSALNETQRQDIYRRASVRIMESTGDVKRFWGSINFQGLVSGKQPSLPRTMIVESEDQPTNPRLALVAMSKTLKR